MVPDFWHTGAPHKRGIYVENNFKGIMETQELAQRVCLLMNIAARMAEGDEELAAVLRGQ